MSRRVLVCDDDRLSALWFERLLKEWGWSVQTSLSVDEAVAAFKETPPDVLISDLRLDDRTAQDLLKQLDIETGPNGFPVIVVSATAQEELQSLDGLEGIATLSKPVDPGHLQATLSAIVKLGQPGREEKISCLILDNGGIGSRTLGRMIEDFGAIPLNAPDLEAAKTLIRNVRPDAIILESDGSASDAEELSDHCTNNKLKLPPMVVLSPVINEVLVDQLLIAGAVDILLKPVSSNRLKEALQMLGGEAIRVTAKHSDGKREILVVEDFMITSKTYERLLTQAGYHVRIVRSAEMAFEMIRRVRPDLLLLDMNLPGMSGYDLLKALMQSGQAVPTIVATGDQDQRKLGELSKLGILKRFDKPVHPEQLVSFVKNFFSDNVASESGEEGIDVLLALVDEGSSDALSVELERHSLKCKSASDPQDAIQEMGGRPRVVVLDIEFGAPEEADILQRFRESAQPDFTRILVVASGMDDETSAKLVENGAHECLGKPYEMQVLVEKIQKLMTVSTPTISANEVADAVMPDIERAFEQSDDDLFKAAARIGHNLKNTCTLANMPSVAKLAAALEDAANKQVRDSCEKLLKEMQDGLNRAVAEEFETAPAKL